MKLYRIYTENTGQTPEEILKLLKVYGFDGATIFYGMGIYGGRIEKSLIIEIAIDENYVDFVRGMAYNLLNRWTAQETIMLVHPDNTVEFIHDEWREK